MAEHADGCGYSGLDPARGVGRCVQGCPVGDGFLLGTDRHVERPVPRLTPLPDRCEPPVDEREADRMAALDDGFPPVTAGPIRRWVRA